MTDTLNNTFRVVHRLLVLDWNFRTRRALIARADGVANLLILQLFSGRLV